MPGIPWGRPEIEAWLWRAVTNAALTTQRRAERRLVPVTWIEAADLEPSLVDDRAGALQRHVAALPERQHLNCSSPHC